ncbi:MAG: T9SS type A sorting domain-containing protein [Candidatus Kapabacteria bacterium]|nr:T9SS type A sorting domain-containing protein [Candidatus Kapabacteria bacterium]
MKFLFIVCLVIIQPALDILSQDYLIKRSVVGSSSQTAYSDEFVAQGIVGQPLIGISANANNEIYFGYWYDGENFSIIQSIHLLNGWNIISSYLIPDNLDIEMIFDSISDDIVIVKNNAGQVYIPMFDINDIGNWNIKDGYQVYTAQATGLNIFGKKINPAITPINLPFGWNIVAYLRSSVQDIKQSMKSLTDDNALVIAKNNAGYVYIPEFDINDIQNMIPGEGYQVYLSKSSTLTYPANFQEKPAIYDYSYKPKKLIPDFTNTGNNSTLILNVNSEDGSEIGVYDSRGVLIGSGVVKQQFAAVTIWGDDPNSDLKTGAETGEKLTVKILNSASGGLHDIELNEIHSILNKQHTDAVTYYPDAVNFGKAVFDGFTDILRLTPNPADNYINLEFDVINPGNSSIKFYSIIGHELCTISDEHREIGTYQLKFNVEKYPNGVYSIMYEHNGDKFVKNLIIVR